VGVWLYYFWQFEIQDEAMMLSLAITNPTERSPRRPRPSCHSKTNKTARIHFPLSVTTRNLKNKINRVEDLPLIQYALASIVDTIEPELFDYGIYIAADQGDPWLDNTTHLASIRTWFENYFYDVWNSRFCVPELEFFIYVNTHSRNTWAINYVTQIAFERGYDYFYRINDDSILSRDRWSSQYVTVMRAMRPFPNVGVVGPWDAFFSGKVLTHSFISRLHLLIYGTHFNFLYGNWYSDPWIQEIYSSPYPEHPNATFTSMAVILVSVKVKHLVLKSRYEVQATVALHKQQVLIDREVFHTYLLKELDKLYPKPKKPRIIYRELKTPLVQAGVKSLNKKIS